MAVYLFFDESGDLNFSPTGSRYYFFGALTTREPAAMTQRLGELRYQLLESGIDLERFHAAEDRQSVRDQVFSAIVAIGGFEFDAVIVEKAKTYPALQNEARFYPQLASSLLQYVFGRYNDPGEQIIIVTDRLPIAKKQKTVVKLFKKYISGHLTGRPYAIYHHTSTGHPCLQAADYCMWAVHKKWTQNDTRSHALVARFIRSEFDIFATGTKRFY